MTEIWGNLTDILRYFGISFGWFSDGVVMAGGGEPLEPPPAGDEHEEEEHGDDDEEEEEDVGAAAVERRQAAMQPEPSGTHQTPALRNCSNPCSVQLLLGQVI